MKFCRVLPPGEHEIERIPNPYQFESCWLVLKGTQVGRTEISWREFEHAEDSWKVVIKE